MRLRLSPPSFASCQLPALSPQSCAQLPANCPPPSLSLWGCLCPPPSPLCPAALPLPSFLPFVPSCSAPYPLLSLPVRLPLFSRPDIRLPVAEGRQARACPVWLPPWRGPAKDSPNCTHGETVHGRHAWDDWRMGVGTHASPHQMHVLHAFLNTRTSGARFR